ncbi:MAG TPA: hypothetical protein VGR28_14650 [Candidatus Thermoplasmatota archaeon]|nr:hypothetical protein [Candidatus Thermoplasmatota archaeon]
MPFKSGKDILETQYKSGRSVLERSDWARASFDSLRRRFVHVPEEQLVRLFHNKTQSQLEMIQGDAVFLEYNATHPIGRRRVKVRRKLAPLAAPKVAAPAKRAAPPKPAKAKAKPKARPAPKPRKASAAKRRKR